MSGVSAGSFIPGVSGISSGYQQPNVVVVGATPMGICAALAAAQQGNRVALISDSERIGGILGWGINSQDVQILGSSALVVGLAKKILSAVGKKETSVSKAWSRFHRLSCVGRPSWFIRAMNEAVSSNSNITIYYNSNVVGVKKAGTEITSITVAGDSPVKTFAARAYVDATYTGDLAALAGCTVSIGREATSLYGEANAGVLAAGTWTGPVTIDPYVTPGNSGSGLLPGIDSNPLGTVGSGDGRVMSVCYRLFVTTAAGDRIPFPDPDLTTYNALNYELLGRAMAADTTAGRTSYNLMSKLFQFYSLFTASYSDMNSRDSIPCSLNYVSSESLEYITASPSRRAVIRENAKQWFLGLIYWIKNSGDSRIQAGLTADLANYGLSDEELQAYGGFAPELYVREGRRVVGDFVFDQNDMILANGFTDKIAYGYYDIDSHMVRRLVSAGNCVPEGTQQVTLSEGNYGFPIPYRVLLPKASECTNLLCPGSPSVSRVAWCSIRMEPILMALGEAAGIAASEIVREDVTAANVSMTRLQRIQDIDEVWDGIVISTDGTYSAGTVTQSPAASWSTTATRFPFLGASALSNGNVATRTLTFAPYIEAPGAYRVLFKYPVSSTARATNATITVNSNGVAYSRALNQLFPSSTNPGGKGGNWEEIGTFNFRSAGSATASPDTVVVDSTGAGDFVVASAFKFVPVTGDN